MPSVFSLPKWTLFERLWFLFATCACVAVSLIMRDTPLSFVAAVTGILYTLLAGKGVRLCYFFGVVNCIAYALLAVQSRLYGDAMLYGLYYLPMMFIGFFAWKKNLDAQNVICKRRLTTSQRTLLVGICALVILLHAAFLQVIGGRVPGLDSATNILSLAAMVLTVKRCIEQWVLWFVVNLISIIMWLIVYFSTGEASSVIFMYVIFLISGIIFYFQWRPQTKSRDPL